MSTQSFGAIPSHRAYKIFDVAPPKFDLDQVQIEEEVRVNERVEPQLVKIQKEEKEDIIREEKRILASTVEKRKEETENREDQLISLVQESLFEKEMAKRNLGSVIEDDTLSLDSQNNEENFGNFEVRWGVSH